MPHAHLVRLALQQAGWPAWPAVVEFLEARDGTTETDGHGRTTTYGVLPGGDPDADRVPVGVRSDGAIVTVDADGHVRVG